MEPIILNSTKKLLNLAADYTAFDEDILVFLNSSFSQLNELGVGDAAGYVIAIDTTWESLALAPLALALVKTYIYMKVRLAFDPPGTGFLIDSFEKELAQIEWRLVNIHDETAETTYAPEEVVVE